MKFGIMILLQILWPHIIISTENYYKIPTKIARLKISLKFPDDNNRVIIKKSVSEIGTISMADGNRRERNRNKAGGIYVF
jgi:hypothetical protein